MEKLDKEKYLRRLLIVLWAVLFICLGIKMFGADLFEIICTNENFIKICEYADTHAYANYLISTIYCMFSMYFLVLAMCGMKKYCLWQIMIFVPTIIVGNVIKMYNSALGVVFDIWQGIIMPCIFTVKKPERHKFVLLGNALLILFQLVSMYIKNIDFEILTKQGVLISTIYSIDVIIMIVIYYLYSISKKGKNNG